MKDKRWNNRPNNRINIQQNLKTIPEFPGLFVLSSSIPSSTQPLCPEHYSNGS
ncbi:MAG: hypothetical protein ACD_2C00263G0013 [uncultured bacterium (gcode 4)]|uniref:Uncharacterized protein n=1 Tax=uncultured bacterium (gcode 4) TaxID=1234023 RepID=K2G3P5_9BACT|nr:MAG: hypothetical protein ACD_2C00263G0013 [uncultured bacterium (gcode 4)]